MGRHGRLVPVGRLPFLNLAHCGQAVMRGRVRLHLRTEQMMDRGHRLVQTGDCLLILLLRVGVVAVHGERVVAVLEILRLQEHCRVGRRLRGGLSRRERALLLAS